MKLKHDWVWIQEYNHFVSRNTGELRHYKEEIILIQWFILKGIL
jgi:hypothetical protein